MAVFLPKAQEEVLKAIGRAAYLGSLIVPQVKKKNRTDQSRFCDFDLPVLS